ncbi:unnamed protein product [Chondrus crispus]|uniref:Uncharacterized protein n=1 Tax=Chondrus crispus TaxID=2769 RepID=R7QG28_CHOCR|nr:unnamed protein product [Chondrus crispus]CDF37009.1 unnamed protein product [Chondrus crispus]|eukprot:XP_005716828.1 unnamed protein product [Chondrus crispus]
MHEICRDGIIGIASRVHNRNCKRGVLAKLIIPKQEPTCYGERASDEQKLRPIVERTRAVACFFAPNVFLRQTCSLIGLNLNMIEVSCYRRGEVHL